MRYGPDHKAESRNHILEKAGARVKRDGFAATGLSALMATAGVTTGAFYSQFKGKSELLQAVFEHEIGKMLPTLEGQDPETVRRVLAQYVSGFHVAHPELGCPIPALAAEIGRAGQETRESFEDAALRIHAAVARAIGDADAAWSIVAQAAGAILIARAMASADKRADVLKAVAGAIDGLFEASAANADPALAADDEPR